MDLHSMTDEQLQRERERQNEIVARADEDMLWCDVALAYDRYVETKKDAEAEVAAIDAELERRSPLAQAS